MESGLGGMASSSGLQTPVRGFVPVTPARGLTTPSSRAGAGLALTPKIASTPLFNSALSSSTAAAPAAAPSSASQFQQAAATASTPAHGVIKKEFTLNYLPPGGNAKVSVLVTGGLKSLGSWVPARGRQMECIAPGQYRLEVFVPANSEFRYKFIVLQHSGDKAEEVCWESDMILHCANGTDSAIENATDAAAAVAAAAAPVVAAAPAQQPCLISFDSPAAAAAPALTPSKRQIGDMETMNADMLMLENEDLKRQLTELKKGAVTASATKDEENSNTNHASSSGGGIFGLSTPRANLFGGTISVFQELQSSAKKTKDRLFQHNSSPLHQQQQQQQQQAPEVVGSATKAISSSLSSLQLGAGGAGVTETTTRRTSFLSTSLSSSSSAAAAVDTTALLKEKEDLQQLYDLTLRELEDARVQHLATVEKLQADRQAEEAARAMVESSVRCFAGELQALRKQYLALKEETENARDGTLPLFASISEDVVKAVGGVVGGIEKEMEDTRAKYRKEVAERKKIHNELLDLRGAIRVFCRVRPLNSKDVAAGRQSCVACPDETSLVVGGNKFFTFDQVFAPTATQEEVFKETVPLVVSVLDGYNACIFAYGQTGSGKTHTMEGSTSNPGVNVRALSALFELAEERKEMCQYEIKVSLMEIYNETIRDLLDPTGKGGDGKLDVKQAVDGSGGSFVPDLTTVTVENVHAVLNVLAVAHRNRSCAATNMNEHSSRSHMILTVYTATRTNTIVRPCGKLHLIDLAGSERISKSGATGDRLTEAKNINKSLSALGDVVAALVAKKGHVPFRNSKLTFFLQDSLGGESKVLMFTNISPSDSDVQETTCSLNFAARVRNVELGAAKKSGGGDIKAIMNLREKEVEIDKLRERVKILEEQASTGNAAQEQLARLLKKQADSEETVKSKDWAISDLEQRLSSQEVENEALREEIHQLRMSNSKLAESMEGLRHQMAENARENNHLIQQLQQQQHSSSAAAAPAPLAAMHSSSAPVFGAPMIDGTPLRTQQQSASASVAATPKNKGVAVAATAESTVFTASASTPTSALKNSSNSSSSSSSVFASTSSENIPVSNAMAPASSVSTAQSIRDKLQQYRMLKATGTATGETTDSIMPHKRHFGEEETAANNNGVQPNTTPRKRSNPPRPATAPTTSSSSVAPSFSSSSTASSSLFSSSSNSQASSSLAARLASSSSSRPRTATGLGLLGAPAERVVPGSAAARRDGGGASTTSGSCPSAVKKNRSQSVFGNSASSSSSSAASTGKWR